MPCSDGGPRDYDGATQARLDSVTRLLCGLCKRIQKSGRDTLIYEDKKLAEWWMEHQEQDRQRVAAEQAAREKRRKINDEILDFHLKMVQTRNRRKKTLI